MINRLKKKWGELSGQIEHQLARARTYEAQEIYAEAAKCYQAVLQYDPDFVEAREALMRCYAQYKLQQQALPLVQEAAALEGKRAWKEALDTYARAYRIWPGARLKAKLDTLRAQLRARYDGLLRRAREAEKAEAYGQAHKYYAAALQMDDRDPEIAGAIARCLQRQATVDEANRHLQKGDTQARQGYLLQALEAFQAAYSVWSVPRVQAKVADVENKIARRKQFLEALNAEKEGDLDRAGRLYAALVKSGYDDVFQTRWAICETRRGNWEQAVARFARLPAAKLDPEARYHYGYALIQKGALGDGLKHWRTLSSPKVLELVKAFERHQTVAWKREVAHLQELCFDQGQYVEALHVARTLLKQQKDEHVEALLPYLEQKALGEMEEAGDFKAALNLIRDGDWGLWQRAVVLLQLVHQDASYLREAVAYGISVVLSDEIYTLVQGHAAWMNGQKIDRQHVREALLRHLNRLIQETIAAHPRLDVSLIDVFNFEIEYTRRLKDLRLEGFPPMSPSLALILRRREEILNALASLLSKADESQRELILDVGAAYAPANHSFRILLGGEPEVARKTLKPYKDPFSEYVRARVHFACVLHKVAREDWDLLAEIPGAVPHAQLTESNRQVLVEAVNKAAKALHNEDRLDTAKALAQRALQAGLADMQKTLSTLLNYEAVQKSNDDKKNLNEIRTILEEALRLDPDNDRARENLDQVLADIDLPRVQACVDRDDLDGAIRIARNSKSRTIKTMMVDHLITRIRNTVEHWESLSPYERIPEWELNAILTDRLRKAESLDPDHSEVRRLLGLLT